MPALAYWWGARSSLGSAFCKVNASAIEFSEDFEQTMERGTGLVFRLLSGLVREARPDGWRPVSKRALHRIASGRQDLSSGDVQTCSKSSGRASFFLVILMPMVLFSASQKLILPNTACFLCNHWRQQVTLSPNKFCPSRLTQLFHH